MVDYGCGIMHCQWNFGLRIDAPVDALKCGESLGCRDVCVNIKLGFGSYSVDARSSQTLEISSTEMVKAGRCKNIVPPPRSHLVSFPRYPQWPRP